MRKNLAWLALAGLLLATPGKALTTPIPGRARISRVKVSFGRLRVGKAKSQTIRITNIGGDTLYGSIGIVQTPFRTTEANEFAIGTASYLNIHVHCLPLEPGKFNQTLMLATGDPDRPQVGIDLSVNAYTAKH